MRRRGQFFLAAAIIIVGIVIGLASVVNSVRVSGEQEVFYDKSKEVGYETNRVLDYGVFNSEPDLNMVLEDFLIKYSDYIAQEQVVFLYGDETNMEAIYFIVQDTGSVSIDTNSGLSGSGGAIIPLTGKVETNANAELVGNMVNVEIEGVNYEFDLKEGQNFFFVMIKTEGEERYVAQKQ